MRRLLVPGSAAPFTALYGPQVLLYEIIALVIAAGLWATVSLLWRHWDSIEQHAGKQVCRLAALLRSNTCAEAP